MYSLLEAGHHVTFVSDFQEPNPPTNFTYIVPKMSKLDQNIMNKTDFKSLSTMQYFHSLRHRLFSSCFDVMEIPEIQVIVILHTIMNKFIGILFKRLSE